MNNAVFGKTMENVQPCRCKIINKMERTIRHRGNDRKTKFPQSLRLAKNLIGVELHKFEVKLNKPIYVCVYSTLLLFRDKCNIIYTDMDNLIYRVECEDERMKRDRFDMTEGTLPQATLCTNNASGLWEDILGPSPSMERSTHCTVTLALTAASQSLPPVTTRVSFV